MVQKQYNLKIHFNSDVSDYCTKFIISKHETKIFVRVADLNHKYKLVFFSLLVQKMSALGERV